MLYRSTHDKQVAWCIEPPVQNGTKSSWCEAKCCFVLGFFLFFLTKHEKILSANISVRLFLYRVKKNKKNESISHSSLVTMQM